MEIEGIAEPQTLAVTVRIEGSDVYADFTGTAAQVRRPVNCPINYTRAYVALPLKLVCDPILPNNQGTYEPLHLSVPEGTLLNPTFPAACFWRLSAGMLVSELMFRVLSRIAPDRVPADSGSMPTWQFYVNGVRPNGEAFALHQHAFGGMGGRPGDDGLASVSFPYNVRDVSIEWSEMETPVLYEARELIADSGGAGEFRGGLGQELILQAYGGRVKKGEPLVLSGSAGRMRFPPRGLLGGGDGSYGAIEVNGEADCAFELAERDVSGGDVVRLRLPGGGGHGEPARRRRERIEADLKAGYVTAEGARRTTGTDSPPTACRVESIRFDGVRGPCRQVLCIQMHHMSHSRRCLSNSRLAGAKRWRWFLLRGLSGMVISINPASRAGNRCALQNCSAFLSPKASQTSFLVMRPRASAAAELPR